MLYIREKVSISKYVSMNEENTEKREFRKTVQGSKMVVSKTVPCRMCRVESKHELKIAVFATSYICVYQKKSVVWVVPPSLVGACCLRHQGDE
jgi:hypothetical protein